MIPTGNYSGIPGSHNISRNIIINYFDMYEKDIVNVLGHFWSNLPLRSGCMDFRSCNSKIGFTVTHHMISEIDGYFRAYQATMTTAEDDFSDAVFEFSADIESINTESERRDNHLRSAGIFDAEKHPTMNFKSISCDQIAGNRYKVSGNFTIKGKTLPIALDLWLVGPVKNDRGKRFEIGAKAVGKLNRRDFGVGENLPFGSVG